MNKELIGVKAHHSQTVFLPVSRGTGRGVGWMGDTTELLVSRARRTDWWVWLERVKGRLVIYVHISRSLANIPAKPHSGTHVMQQWACLNAFSDWNSCEAPGAEKFVTSYQLG